MTQQPWPLIKTRSEQRLEWLESLRRPLSDQESDELRRALHAVYCHNRKISATFRNRAAYVLVAASAIAGA